MSRYVIKEFANNQVSLLVVIASFWNENLNTKIEEQVDKIFKDIAPFLSQKKIFLYIRDLENYVFEIDGKKYIGTYSADNREIFVNVPAWPCKEDELIADVAKELFSLAYNQVEQSVGSAVLAAGLAIRYGEVVAGWIPPWVHSLSSHQANWIIDNWSNKDFDYENLLYNQGGLAAGYKIAKQLVAPQTKLADILQHHADDTRLKNSLHDVLVVT
ncbi:MAG: hypothetical protein ACREGJ_01165 [Candidatus Saccharimonadales bacterium]